MSQAAGEYLTALILPLADRQLLVPNVLLAELVSVQTPTTLAGAPDWLLGSIGWRERQVPLLSFEAAAGGVTEGDGKRRIGIFNAVAGLPGLAYYALQLRGIPHSLRVDAQLPRAEAPLTALECDAVALGERVLKIPDLDALEQLLGEALAAAG